MTARRRASPEQQDSAMGLQPREPEAVIFDWGGTLTPWRSIDVEDQWRAYAHGYDPAHNPSVTAALAAAEARAWERSRDEHRSCHFDEIVRAAGLEPIGPRHERGLEAFQEFWEPHTYVVSDAIQVLTALRQRGLKVGVLSNTVWSRDHHERIFARDGVLELLDGAVYSSEIARTKPHADAFTAAMAAVGIARPDRCVFVGDRLFDDIYGAQSVGMRGVFLPHSEIPEHQRGHTEGEPDAVVDRLGELLELVDQWAS